MNEITVGVLTISDRCSRNEAVDESGPSLVQLLTEGIIKNVRVVKTGLVPDSEEDIERVLKQWCDGDLCLVLTTGGTGVSERDVTPEATAAVLEKNVPGIPLLMFQRSSAVTPLAALSRGVAGVRGRSLVINLPGSKKASKECLEAVASVIPHAIDLIRGRKKEVERIHTSLKKKSLFVAPHAELRKRTSAYNRISVDDAQKILEDRVCVLITEKVVNYKEALGCVLAQCVYARQNFPPQDVSIMDGYALSSADTSYFIRSLIGVSHLGQSVPQINVGPETCVRVSTGAPIPPGANCVVKVEDTEVLSLNESENIKIKILKSFSANENIRKMGSDYTNGDKLLSRDTCIDSAALGLLATAGVTSLRVFAKPKVAVISTGNELVEPDNEIEKGKVRDSNRIMILSLLKKENFEAEDLGITPDNPDALRDSFEKAFQSADVVVTTGSMSMGERDFLKEVFTADFNGEIHFGRVNMKPGMPTAFGTAEFEGKAKLWFGLPGNPASGFVTSHLFLLPALRLISKRQNPFPRLIYIPKSDLNSGLNIQRSDRPEYVRGILEFDAPKKHWSVKTTGFQRSSWIGSCIGANCLILYDSSNRTYDAHFRVFLIGEVQLKN